MMVDVINRKEIGVQSIKLKYFTAGHTFMSADNFHKGVENEMKEMNNVYDLHDFRRCVSVAGEVTLSDVMSVIFSILKKVYLRERRASQANHC